MDDESQKKKMGDKIYRIRKMAGLSQEEFAEKIGVTRQTVSNWELGEKLPRSDKIKKICDFMEIKYEEFIEDSDEEKLGKKICESKKRKLEEKELKKAREKRDKLFFTAIMISLLSCVFINLMIYFKI